MPRGCSVFRTKGEYPVATPQTWCKPGRGLNAVGQSGERHPAGRGVESAKIAVPTRRIRGFPYPNRGKKIPRPGKLSAFQGVADSARGSNLRPRRPRWARPIVSLDASPFPTPRADRFSRLPHFVVRIRRLTRNPMKGVLGPSCDGNFFRSSPSATGGPPCRYADRKNRSSVVHNPGIGAVDDFVSRGPARRHRPSSTFMPLQLGRAGRFTHPYSEGISTREDARAKNPAAAVALARPARRPQHLDYRQPCSRRPAGKQLHLQGERRHAPKARWSPRRVTVNGACGRWSAATTRAGPTGRAYGRGRLQIPALLAAVSPWSSGFSFPCGKAGSTCAPFFVVAVCRQANGGLRGAGAREEPRRSAAPRTELSRNLPVRESSAGFSAPLPGVAVTFGPRNRPPRPCRASARIRDTPRFRAPPYPDPTPRPSAKRALRKPCR